MLKRYAWIEGIAGLAVFLLGIWTGGSSLPALGCFFLSVGICCAAKRRKRIGVTVAAAGIALLLCLYSAVLSFSYLTSVTGYSDQTSPLSVLLILSVLLLGQAFLTVPLENRTDSAGLRRWILAGAILAGVLFLSILISYFLSFWQFNHTFSEYIADASAAIPDFMQIHYFEGAAALTVVLSGIRMLVLSFTGSEPSALPSDRMERDHV